MKGYIIVGGLLISAFAYQYWTINKLEKVNEQQAKELNVATVRLDSLTAVVQQYAGTTEELKKSRQQVAKAKTQVEVVRRKPKLVEPKVQAAFDAFILDTTCVTGGGC